MLRLSSFALAAALLGAPGALAQDNAHPDAKYGGAVAVGDFDGDGDADLVAASAIRSEVVLSLFEDGEVARTVVFRQGAGGVPGMDEPGDAFGAALAVGDFNGDGHDDLAIGQPGEAIGSVPDAGAITVLYGGSGVLHLDGARDAQGFSQNTRGIPGAPEAGDRWGLALAAGDFNGDGRDDLAVGAPYEDIERTADAGLVTVLMGSGNGLRATGAYHRTQNDDGTGQIGPDPGNFGAEAGDRFGHTLASGDFDGDGKDDLAVGVPYEDFGPATDAGYVVVYWGTARELRSNFYTLTWHGGIDGAGPDPAGGSRTSGDLWGLSLAAADLNGDGRDDLAVGSPHSRREAGRRTGSSMEDCNPLTRYVFRIFCDGFTNPSRYTAATPEVPSVTVFLGGASPRDLFEGPGAVLIDGTSAEWAGGPIAGTGFGASLAAGEVTGDGYADLIVGMPASGGGEIAILPGGRNGASAFRMQRLRQGTDGMPGADEAGDEMGATLAVMGGADGMLVAGAPGEAIGTKARAGHVVALPLDGSGRMRSQRSVGVVARAE